MQQSDVDTLLPVPLYHGTSSLFLDGILKFGLGGRNPIAEWKVLEFARAIFPLVEEHLSHLDDFMARTASFRLMVEQKSAAMNFQHGETYMSPAASTAVRYALNKRCGSELLTYTLDFLDELLRRKVPGVANELYRQYPQVYARLDFSPAPLLIKVEGLRASALRAESGSDPGATVERIIEILRDAPDLADGILQQSNFRLSRPVPAAALKVWLINVTKWDVFLPEYSLHTLSLERESIDA